MRKASGSQAVRTWKRPTIRTSKPSATGSLCSTPLPRWAGGPYTPHQDGKRCLMLYWFALGPFVDSSAKFSSGSTGPRNSVLWAGL